MRKIYIFILTLSLAFSLTACNNKELTATKVYSLATHAFNKLDSATVKAYSETQTLVSNPTPQEEEAPLPNREPVKVYKDDVIKIQFQGSKRISYTESIYNGEADSISKYYLDNHKNRYFQTDYQGNWETVNGSKISKLALSSSDTIYWADINKNTVESETLEKTDTGYRGTLKLNSKALERYTTDFANQMGIDVTLANIVLTFTTNEAYEPLSLECTYFRTYIAENYRYEIDVIDRFTYSDFNSTQLPAEPVL